MEMPGHIAPFRPTSFHFCGWPRYFSLLSISNQTELRNERPLLSFLFSFSSSFFLVRNNFYGKKKYQGIKTIFYEDFTQGKTARDDPRESSHHLPVYYSYIFHYKVWLVANDGDDQINVIVRFVMEQRGTRNTRYLWSGVKDWTTSHLSFLDTNEPWIMGRDRKYPSAN